MDNLQLVKEKQSVVYNILNNALKENKLSHAYMFFGVKGSLQEEMALLLIQSLFCEESFWACQQCNICKRIADNNYPDLIILDGSKSSIKKEDVRKLQHQFSMTSLEKYKHKVFIIKDAHNMTIGAANSLLKFLEEPSENVIGILISDQKEAILPTVISRCQVINFNKLSYLDNLQLARQANINEFDAYLYAQIVNNYFSLNDFLEEEAYQLSMLTFKEFIDLFDTKPDLALYRIHSILLKSKDKKMVKVGFNIFIDMLILFFSDTISSNQDVSNWYDNSRKRYRERINYDLVLEKVLESKSQINASINIPLAVDQMLYNLKEVM